MTETTMNSGLYAAIQLALIFLIFYFLLIRPQKKRIAEHQRRIDALKVGDMVLINGIYGKITSLSDNDEVMVEIAKGTQIKAVKSLLTPIEGA